MLYKENPSAYTRCEKCRHIDRENEECKVANDKWLVCDDAGECRQFSQEGVSMKVRCIDNIYESDSNKIDVRVFTKDMIYVVIEDLGTGIMIRNDFNEIGNYPKEYFQVIKGDELDVDLSSKYHITTYDKEATGKVEHENVDHPNHYNKGKFEVIEVIEDWDLNFHLGNTIKYIARAKHKGRELEDLEKAMWYLNREIEMVKAND